MINKEECRFRADNLKEIAEKHGVDPQKLADYMNNQGYDTTQMVAWNWEFIASSLKKRTVF